MKDQIVLSDEEKEIVHGFMRMKYPPIYKMDSTDRILFVELVEFDVCPYLLGKNQIDRKRYNYILNEHERYLSQTDILMFDDYAQEHFRLIVELIELFKKYYNIRL